MAECWQIGRTATRKCYKRHATDRRQISTRWRRFCTTPSTGRSSTCRVHSV